MQWLASLGVQLGSEGAEPREEWAETGEEDCEDDGAGSTSQAEMSKAR